jgi:hypothetical protein
LAATERSSLADLEHAHVALVQHRRSGDLLIARLLRRQLADRADIAEEFVRVGLILERIVHPRLVPVRHVGRVAGGQPYLVMDHVHGRQLTDLMADPSVRRAERIVEIGLHMAGALAVAHGAGLLHLNLTPDSVLLTDGVEGATVLIVNARGAHGIPVPPRSCRRAAGRSTRRTAGRRLTPRNGTERRFARHVGGQRHVRGRQRHRPNTQSARISQRKRSRRGLSRCRERR